MNLSIRLILGVGTGAGLLLVIAGLRGVELFRSALTRATRNRRTRDDTQLIESLAIWTEQLRDTMAGSSGLEQAVTVTAQTAPELLRPAVQGMSARLGFAPLPESARQFADDVNHALADFVAAALITASENQVRDMGSLLGHLAECCRSDVLMRTRVWVARARLRSAVRIITIVVVVFILGLYLLNPTYLEPYGSTAGFVALLIIASLFAGALQLLHRLGRLDTPERFVARRTVVGST